MVKSLRIWAQASGMICEEGRFKPLAKRLFTRDPYLESVESVALLHWLICSNRKHFTANTWLFNYFHVSQFSVKQAVSRFREYLSLSGANYAEGTVQVDIETALRMYTGINDRVSYDMDDKFLYPLGLFSVRRVDGKTIFSRSWETERPLVSTRVLTYTVLSALAASQTDKSTLSDLYSSNSTHTTPGVVFGYTKDGFYTAIEKMVHVEGGNFSMTSLPGGDFQIATKSNLSKKCGRGDADIAEKHCFPEGN